MQKKFQIKISTKSTAWSYFIILNYYLYYEMPRPYIRKSETLDVMWRK